MPKTFTNLVRHALNGPTMGTRWAALVHARSGLDIEPMRKAMQAAVDRVDSQMSTWKADSDLMRFNAAPLETWIELPQGLMEVLTYGLEVGRLSQGAFDLGMGDAVSAWGFTGAKADPEYIRASLQAKRRPAHEVLELDPVIGRAKKLQPIWLDLSGIAKGYGVDRLAAVAREHGFKNMLLSIDGELVAMGTQSDGSPWTIAVEEPDYERRAAHSVLQLEDMAVATSGDYRHWVDVGGKKLSHTMDPRRGAPLINSPASVTVIAKTCMEADAWATAMMVMGETDGTALARHMGLDVLFLMRDSDGVRPITVGKIFG
jgi:FAD:protein FMN transferase